MGTTSGCDGDELFDGTEGGYIAAIHGVRVKEVVVDGENGVGIAVGAGFVYSRLKMRIRGAMGMRGYRMSRAVRGNRRGRVRLRAARGRGRLRDAGSAARCAGAGRLRGLLRGVGRALRGVGRALRVGGGRVGCALRGGGGGCALRGVGCALRGSGCALRVGCAWAGSAARCASARASARGWNWTVVIWWT
jgi:ribosomal protein S6E (S10)